MNRPTNLNMKEKLAGTPEAGSAGHESGGGKPTLETLQAGILEILRGRSRPATTAELTALVAETGGWDVEQRHVKLALEELRRAGRAECFGSDSAGRRPNPGERIEDLLETTRDPMTTDRIMAELRSRRGAGVEKRATLRSWLHRLQKQGKIKRLEEGVYAWKGFDGREYRRKRISRPGQLVLDIIDGRPEESFSCEELVLLIEAETGIGAKAGNVKSRLHHLCDRNLIKRVGRGRYASLASEAEAYELPEKSAAELIMEAVESAGGAVPFRGIVDYLRSAGHGASENNVRGKIAAMVDSERLLRLKPGVFAAAGFDGGEYRPPPTLKDRVADVLRRSGRAMRVKEVVAELAAADERKPVSSGSVHKTLLNMKRQNLASSPGRGFFAAPAAESGGRQNGYFLPDETLLAIVKETGTEAGLEEIAAAVRETGIDVSQETIRKKLTKLTDREELERAGAGWRLAAAETAEAAPDDGNAAATGNIYKEIRRLLADIDDWESPEDLLDFLEKDGYAVTAAARAFAARRFPS